MTYDAGIDLGTTYTAAAIHRDGRSQIFALGDRASAIPSVVHLKDDGEVIVGDAAVRRAVSEPGRVAREFKRRLGDTTPVIVGGTPYSAEALTARLLRAVVDELEEREGEAPRHLAISHPANWGEYKLDLLRQAVRLAGLDDDAVVLLSEPEAAALSYAAQQRVDPGEVIAVYDLGGGTFDAAVLRRTDDGFEIIGRPEGIERLGGIDFDAAIAAHVGRSLDGALEELDPEEPAHLAAMARIKQECVDAKEALSADTDAAIPILLPDLQTEVRITRTEFENLIRPSLVDSIGAMHRAVASAGVAWDDVSRVLLVGGSSRIPLIGQMVASELGRPVAVDAHPKDAIALGAAYAAATSSSPARLVVDDPAPVEPTTAGTVPVVPPTDPAPQEAAPPPAAPVAPPPAAPTPPARPEPLGVPDLDRPRTDPVPAAAASAAAATGGPAATAAVPPIATGDGAGGGSGGGSRLPLIGAIAAVVALVVVGIIVTSGGDGDGDDTATDDTTVIDAGDDEDGDEDADATSTTTTTEATTTTTTLPEVDAATVRTAVTDTIDPDFSGVEVAVDDNTATLTGAAMDEGEKEAVLAALGAIEGLEVDDQMSVQPEDEACTGVVRMQPAWACLTGATWDGSTISGTYIGSPDEGGVPFSIASGLHLHLYSDTFEIQQVGTAGPFSDGSGAWQVWDTPGEFSVTPGQLGVGEVPERICAVIANEGHSVQSLEGGTCVPIEDTTTG